MNGSEYLGLLGAVYIAPHLPITVAYPLGILLGVLCAIYWWKEKR